ncbi:MAG: T9SS type A sorting domain-containing protein [Bacteroidota bacterium]|nr:T9SS type A sorting domain-containing protein [Bacteroidota bacterium]
MNYKTMRLVYFLISIAIIASLVVLQKPQNPIDFNAIYRAPSESPKERKIWDKKRLVDANGNIPRGMRKKELRFAKTLPNDLNNSNLEWTAEGPYNVGGRTRALAFDVLDENILLAGGVSGGIWRSSDLGQSWVKMTKPNQLHNVTCITQDTRTGKEHIWYYGTGELSGNSASGANAYFDGNGIYKSSDGGLSWDSIPSTADNNAAGSFNVFDFAWNIALDATNNDEDELYLATYGGIYRSVDAGETWVRELGGISADAYYTNVEINSQGVVYATLSSDGDQEGFWRSEDGMDWVNITPKNFSNIYGRTAMAINPSDENEVYFLTAETTNSGQFTNTFFGGETWTSLWKYNYLCGDGLDSCGLWVDLSSNIPANRATTFDNFNAQGGYDLMIKVKPDDPNVVFIGGTNLWRSTDGFTSDNNTTQIGGYYEGSDHGYGNWDIYSKHHPDQHELLFLPSDPNKILSANDGGVYFSENCLASPHLWKSLNNGYQTTQLYSVTQGKGTTNLIIGGFQDNGNFISVSDDQTDAWVMPFNGDGCYNAVADNGEDFYLQIQRGVLFKMKLNEQGQVLAYNRMDPLGADTSTYDFINYLVMDPNDDNIIYLNNQNQLWRNNQAGDYPYNNSQTRTNIGWHVFSSLTEIPISCMDVSTSPPNILYLGSTNNIIYRIDNAHEGDPAIEPLAILPIGFGNKNISAVEVDPTNADRVLVLLSNYSTYSFLFTDNGGESWKKVGGNLEESLSGGGDGPSMRTAEIAVLGSDTLYLVGGSTGLYATDKLKGLETEWRQIGTSTIGNVVVEHIQFRESDGRLVVGTHGTGVYSTIIESVYDVFPIWSYECIEGACEEKVDGSGSYEILAQCLDSCVIPITENAIYPNPTNDFCIIEWKESEQFNTLVMSDIQGKAIRSWDVNDINQLRIETTEYSSGIYLITLVSDKQKITQRLVIE